MIEILAHVVYQVYQPESKMEGDINIQKFTIWFEEKALKQFAFD